MSFVLYNQSAFNYEINATEAVNLCQIIDTSSSITPQDYQDLQYSFWKQAESLKPADYDSFALPQSTVNLLEQEIPEFSFPRDGLTGESKEQLVQQIRNYLTVVELSCWQLRKRLKLICEFLERHPTVYHF